MGEPSPVHDLCEPTWLEDFTDALAAELTPVAPCGPHVCPLCRAIGPTRDGLCELCLATSTVGHPCRMVIPISYYTKPSALRDWMHHYKRGADPEATEFARKAVAGILVGYVSEHREALIERFGEWDAVVAVPSTKHDAVASLQTAVEDHYPGVIGQFGRPLRRGPDQLSFGHSSEQGFTAGADIKGSRILLIDDTFTTGARVQSAHHAIEAAGATVATTIVVSRKISELDDPMAAAVLTAQRQVAFRFADRPWWCHE